MHVFYYPKYYLIENQLPLYFVTYKMFSTQYMGSNFMYFSKQSLNYRIISFFISLFWYYLASSSEKNVTKAKNRIMMQNRQTAV